MKVQYQLCSSSHMILYHLKFCLRSGLILFGFTANTAGLWHLLSPWERCLPSSAALLLPLTPSLLPLHILFVLRLVASEYPCTLIFMLTWWKQWLWILPLQGAARTPSPTEFYIPPGQKPEAIVHAMKVDHNSACVSWWGLQFYAIIKMIIDKRSNYLDPSLKYCAFT